MIFLFYSYYVTPDCLYILPAYIFLTVNFSLISLIFTETFWIKTRKVSMFSFLFFVKALFTNFQKKDLKDGLFEIGCIPAARTHGLEE